MPSNWERVQKCYQNWTKIIPKNDSGSQRREPEYCTPLNRNDQSTTHSDSWNSAFFKQQGAPLSKLIFRTYLSPGFLSSANSPGTWNGHPRNDICFSFTPANLQSKSINRLQTTSQILWTLLWLIRIKAMAWLRGQLGKPRCSRLQAICWVLSSEPLCAIPGCRQFWQALHGSMQYSCKSQLQLTMHCARSFLPVQETWWQMGLRTLISARKFKSYRHASDQRPQMPKLLPNSRSTPKLWNSCKITHF